MGLTDTDGHHNTGVCYSTRLCNTNLLTHNWQIESDNKIAQKSQSVSQSLRRVQLCDPMDCSTPGFPIHHQLLDFTQTHVYQVSDAIQPSHPLSSPSLPAFSLSQHQGLLKWVSSSHQVAKVLDFSFSISLSNEYSGLIFFTIDWFDLLAVQWDSQESSSTPLFKSTNSSALSFLYSPTLISIHNYWKNHSFD